MKKAVALIIAALLLVPVVIMPAEAAQPYLSYNYDRWGDSVPAQSGYEFDSIAYIKDLDGNFSTDIIEMVLKNDEFYFVDRANNRIIITDMSFNTVDVVDTLNDGADALKTPNGLFVSDTGEMYVADSDNFRVVVINRDGDVLKELNRPESALYNEPSFRPLKVICDYVGNVYVVSEGVYRGAVQYDPAGEFIGFYGANRVDAGLSVILDSFWRLILTKEQLRARRRNVPVFFNNFDIDERGFVYTVTTLASVSVDRLKKLSPAGINVFDNARYTDAIFGDLEVGGILGKWEATMFSDVKVDDRGYINVLDYQKGRVFQYDKECALMFIFGLNGEQTGNISSKSAVAIEAYDDKIFVLDNRTGAVTAYRMTEFGALAHAANDLYSDGYYEDSVELWQEVLQRDGSYRVGYYGLGNAKYSAGDYKEAMDDFYAGNLRNGYDKAFKAYRTEIMRAMFGWIFFGIVLLVALFFGFGIIRRKVAVVGKVCDASDAWLLKHRYSNPFYAIKHPGDFFDNIRWYNSGSIPVSIALVLALLLGTILKQQGMAYIFNYTYTKVFLILPILFQSILIFCIFTVANWSVCTLMDGIGSFRKIWLVSAYSITPYILSLFINCILSYGLTRTEEVTMQMITGIGIFLSFMMMLISMKAIHDYSLSKTFGSLFMTLLAMLVIVFLFVLVLTLFQQVYVFFRSVWAEVVYRFSLQNK